MCAIGIPAVIMRTSSAPARPLHAGFCIEEFETGARHWASTLLTNTAKYHGSATIPASANMNKIYNSLEG